MSSVPSKKNTQMHSSAEWEVEDESYILLDMGANEAAKKLLLNSVVTGASLPSIEIQGINTSTTPIIQIGSLRFEGRIDEPVGSHLLLRPEKDSIYVGSIDRIVKCKQI